MILRRQYFRRIILCAFVFLLIAQTQPLYADDRKLVVNEKYIETDVPVKEELGRVFVPVRFVTEAVGATIAYDSVGKTVVISYKENYIRHKPGTWYYENNGRSYIMELPSKFENQRVLVPLSFLSKALGLNAVVDGKYGDIIIKGSL